MKQKNNYSIDDLMQHPNEPEWISAVRRQNEYLSNKITLDYLKQLNQRQQNKLGYNNNQPYK